MATIAAALLAGCQTLAPNGAARAEVEAAHAGLASAYSSCHEAAFVAAYADEFAFTTSNTPKAITATSGLRGYLTLGCKLNPNPTAAVKAQTIRFAGNQAVVTGQYLFRVPASGKVVDVLQNFTAVFVRQSGAWKVAAHHVSAAP